MFNRLMLAAAVLPLGACQMAGPTYTPQQIAYNQQQLAEIIGTRVAHAPESCILSSPTMEIRAVGDALVAKYGDRVWVNQVKGNCREAANFGTTLVFDTRPGGMHCRNSLVQVVDNSGVRLGSCALGEWVPYY